MSQLALVLAVSLPLAMATWPVGQPMVLCVDAKGHLALERPHECDLRCSLHGPANGLASDGYADDVECLDLPIEGLDGAGKFRSRGSLNTTGPLVTTTNFSEVEWHPTIRSTPRPLPVLEKRPMLRALGTVVLLL